MKFCSDCGSTNMDFREPKGDNRPRWICGACERIFYENPRVIVGTIPTWEGKLLLCRRAIQPKLGKWTLPAGFLECDETVEAGALRETWEESGAHVKLGPLFTLYNVPQVAQVYMLFLAEIQTPEFPFGPETSEIMLVDPADIPWDELAFASVTDSLRAWVEAPQREAPLFLTHAGFTPAPTEA